MGTGGEEGEREGEKEKDRGERGGEGEREGSGEKCDKLGQLPKMSARSARAPPKRARAPKPASHGFSGPYIKSCTVYIKSCTVY